MSETARKLSFGSIVLFGINCLVGAGIFLTPGRAYHDVGTSVFWILGVCAILAIVMALGFAEMAGKFTRTGGVYVYVKEAFGGFWGFNIGFMRFIVSCMALGVQVTALPSMLADIWPSLSSVAARDIIAIGFIWILCCINLISLKVYEFFTRFTSWLVVITLLFCIFSGIWFVDMGNFATPSPDVVPPFNKEAFSAGFLLLFYAFVGFENIGVAAQDMENPTKNIPKAIITVLIIVTILYFLLFFTTIGVMGPSIADSSNSVAASVSSYMGDSGRTIIFIASIIALTGIGLAMTFAGPRNLVPLAQDNFLPANTGANNSRGIPARSIIIMGIVTTIVVIISNIMTKDSFKLLAQVSTIGRLIQYSAVSLGVLKLRKLGLPGTYKMPIAGLLISIALVVCVFLFTQVNIITMYYAIALIIITLAVYFLYAKPREKRLSKGA